MGVKYQLQFARSSSIPGSRMETQIQSLVPKSLFNISVEYSEYRHGEVPSALRPE